jgi:hypothetical protein
MRSVFGAMRHRVPRGTPAIGSQGIFVEGAGRPLGRLLAVPLGFRTVSVPVRCSWCRAGGVQVGRRPVTVGEAAVLIREKVTKP